MLSSKLYLPSATPLATCNVLLPGEEGYGVDVCTGVSVGLLLLEMKLLPVFFPHFTGFIN